MRLFRPPGQRHRIASRATGRKVLLVFSVMVVFCSIKRGAGSHDHRCDACFRLQGQHRLTLGAIMGAGSIAGGVLGAQWAMSPQARKWVFWLLVLVICAELVHLIIHYVFKTH
jgi:hypothetical protein